MKSINMGGVQFDFRPMRDGDVPVDPEQFEKQLYDQLEQEYPDLWRVCYPRIYSDPKNGQYFSAKKPARQLMLIALKVLNGQVGDSERYEYHLASHLAKYRVPQYWLSPAIAEALGRTQPPGKFDWYNMPLPFEAAVFMIPKGTIVHKTDGNVLFACYGRFRAGVSYTSPLIPGKPYNQLNGGMMLAALVEGGYFIHWNIPLDAYGPVISLPDLKKLIGYSENPVHESAVPLRDGGMKPADHALGMDVAHYIFSSLMLMTSRPDLVTNASLSHRLPAKKNKQPKEFWSPAIIGEHFKIRTEHRDPQGGTHASPRFHWVPGYWREQPYGHGRELRYTKWIEPYTRGGDAA